MKKLNLKNLNLDAEDLLQREHLTSIMGGLENLKFESDGGSYKCCWDNYPSSCSECFANSEPSCTSGASAVSC